uniref:Uncharacterized protein n=1 Tax=Arundo donax TaxID=35708 RepID=A0A0A9G5R6_ARUDO
MLTSVDGEVDVAPALDEHLSSTLAVMPASKAAAAAAAARWMDRGDMPPAAGSEWRLSPWFVEEEEDDKAGDGKLRTALEPLRQSSAAS